MVLATAALAIIAIAISSRSGYIPNRDDIALSQTPSELDVYYDLMGELYESERITAEEYGELYEAYQTRYNDLISEDSEEDYEGTD